MTVLLPKVAEVGGTDGVWAWVFVLIMVLDVLMGGARVTVLLPEVVVVEGWSNVSLGFPTVFIILGVTFANIFVTYGVEG